MSIVSILGNIGHRALPVGVVLLSLPQFEDENPDVSSRTNKNCMPREMCMRQPRLPFPYLHQERLCGGSV